jgi:hypothetical protein
MFSDAAVEANPTLRACVSNRLKEKDGQPVEELAKHCNSTEAMSTECCL